MKVSLFCCAAGSSVDKLSGKLSIFNIITDVGVKSLPLFFPKVAIVGVLHRESTDTSNSILLTGDLNGTILFSHSVRIEFDSSRTNLLSVNLTGLKVEEPGMVEVKMVSSDRIIATYIFSVDYLGEDSAMTPSPTIYAG